MNKNLVQLFSTRFHKEDCVGFAIEIDNNRSLLKDYIELLKNEDPVISMNAGWTLNHIHDNNKQLFSNQEISALINIAIHTQKDAVLRGILRALTDYQFNEEDQGTLINFCFEILTNFHQAIAIKVYAMTIIFNHCYQYPELAHELKIVLEDVMDTGNPGIINRGQKILKKLEKLPRS